MKAIILEGSSASGKTTTAKLLFKLLSEHGCSAKILDEDLTLMPILSNRDSKVSINHLLTVIKKAAEYKVDFLIFDRLHLTASAITSSELNEYQEIEQALIRFCPLLVLLEIKEKDIPSRIAESMKYRGPSWSEYVRKKGNQDQINAHYIEAQKKVKKRFEDSTFNKITFDTSDLDFQSIAEKIFNKVRN